MIVNKRYWMRFLIPLVFLWGCAATYSMQNLRRNLNRYPEYSIVLEDMQEKGNVTRCPETIIFLVERRKGEGW